MFKAIGNCLNSLLAGRSGQAGDQSCKECASLTSIKGRCLDARRDRKRNLLTDVRTGNIAVRKVRQSEKRSRARWFVGNSEQEYGQQALDSAARSQTYPPC